MTASGATGADQVWAAIENEKRRDRFIRRVATVAWSVTFALLLVLGVFAGLSVSQMVRAAMAGQLPWMSAFGIALPFVVVCGVVSLLIATLSTVGVFLRMRTTTLAEVQARLAALEQMLASRGDA
jgi:fumarate reductase subunit C